MTASRRLRPSDSAFVAAVTHVAYESGTSSDPVEPDEVVPDGLWDIVVMRSRGTASVLQTGVITRPVELPFQSGDDYMAISFRPGVYMPRLPGVQMVDRGVLRSTDACRAFQLDADVFETPTFENAEGLVERLVRRGIIVLDDIVDRVAGGREPWASERSVQRRFRWAVGLSPKQLAQIQRARKAVAMLQEGRAVVDVAAELGYADQSHLTRSLRRFMGRTPAQIAARDGQF